MSLGGAPHHDSENSGGFVSWALKAGSSRRQVNSFAFFSGNTAQNLGVFSPELYHE